LHHRTPSAHFLYFGFYHFPARSSTFFTANAAHPPAFFAQILRTFAALLMYIKNYKKLENRLKSCLRACIILFALSAVRSKTIEKRLL